ncbi:MAG: undecaprenyldiphospho-muramoylpentapeptide beta-N-acetylglucosaminyltransferase [Lachnospiraceae bacterium]|nr:undecaprenyldiphospho-muramoylpentapeptide beta-N-acetylglucosaminyltransferase [Lachnospiraceae bacterium]
MKKIVLTGGGTAGHVTPNLALLDGLKKNGFEVSYIGSYTGIEKRLAEEENIPYYGISSGKLRRYFSFKNFSDPFRVLKGYFEAKKHLKNIKPDVVFSKGGFVAVPVVIAAKRRHIPCIIHESDITPGLANKLCIPSATRVCANFPETMKYLPADKAVLTGTPIRKVLFEGSREEGLKFLGFSGDKPVIMVVGGSTGAAALNNAVHDLLPTLLKSYDIAHLCGKGKADAEFEGTSGYRQIEYVDKEMKDVFAAADVVVSRAGANAICEIVALKKPNILIPLPATSSRGDQILNAESFEKRGFSYVLPEEKLTNATLLDAIGEVFKNKDKYIEAMSSGIQNDAVEKILELINNTAK